VLVGLDQSVGERFRYEVELDELANARQLLVVLLGAAVQTQHYRRHVAEYRRAHQRYTNQPINDRAQQPAPGASCTPTSLSPRGTIIYHCYYSAEPQ